MGTHAEHRRRTLRGRIQRALMRRVVLPALNRAMRRKGLCLMRYVEAADRIVLHEAIPWHCLDPVRDEKYPSDTWYGALKERALDTDVILDVGGGGGTTSAWFAVWAKRVYVFEPAADNRASIALHHRIRRIDNVEVVPSAVADFVGAAPLFLKAYGGHHALGDVGASPTVGRTNVPVTTLDAFSAQRGIDHVGLLKVDVEGFEHEVLAGARGLLERRAVDLVLFEYSPAFYRQRDVDPLAPVTLLEEVGYRLTHVDGRPADPTALAGGEQIDLLAEPA